MAVVVITIMVMIMIFMLPVMSVSMSAPVVAVVTIVMSVPRDVFVVVPVIAHEIDRPSACVVFGAMLVPVLLMSGRNMQINRLRRYILRGSRDHDRLRENDRRAWDIADIDLTVEARLADRNGDAYITGECWDGA